MYRFITLVFVLVVIAALHPSRAAAEDDKARAKAAFDRGRASFENKKYLEAADAFREAYKLMPTWKLSFNVGQAEAAAKRYGLALEAFELYLAGGGDDISNDRREEVLSEIRRFREMVGTIEVIAPDGAIVYVDNVNRGTAPLPGRIKVVAAIKHDVFIELNSQPLLKRAVLLSGGDQITVEAGEPDVSAAAPLRESDKESDRESDRDDSQTEVAEDTRTVDEEEETAGADQPGKNKLWITGWVITGVGAGALIGGAITGGKALSLNKDLVTKCETDDLCRDNNQDDVDAMDSLSVASTVLFGVGLAAAATGVVLLIASKKKGERQNNQVSISPALGNQFAGAVLTGRF